MNHQGGVKGWFHLVALKPYKVLQIWIFGNLLYGFTIRKTTLFFDNEGT